MLISPSIVVSPPEGHAETTVTHPITRARPAINTLQRRYRSFVVAEDHFIIPNEQKKLSATDVFREYTRISPPTPQRTDLFA
jgi:hypothetical protein